MSFSQHFLAGVPLNIVMVVSLYLLGLLTLLFSMIVASRLAGGIDFGTLGYILPRAAILLALVTAINLLTCGVLLAGPVWFFGLMLLFDMDRRETRTLTKINWTMNLVWKLLLTVIFSEP